MAERDEHGRFIKGNSAGRGRPPKEYADAFSSIVSPADWHKVIKKALAQALDGQHDARAWLADRLIGKPPQILELRAGEAVLLADVLKRMEARGFDRVEVFQALLAVIGEAPEPEDTEEAEE